jgi:F-type H+-transporting ATPase subunit b
MKPLAALLLVSLGLGTLAFAQETKAEGKSESSSHEEGGIQVWKWANFAILAGGLGYLIAKNAGPMFAARSEKIRRDMIEADEQRREAEERAAAVERRLSNLESEIAALREEARLEAEAEKHRVAQQISAEIAKIQQSAQQEIAAAGKAARLELKRYAAQLAVGLAEHRIRDRMTAARQDALVRGFVRHLQ